MSQSDERSRSMNAAVGGSGPEASDGSKSSRTKNASNPWTPERREAASRRVQEWKPWLRATGPNTPEGKARSSMNAWKGGIRPKQREARRNARAAFAAFDAAVLELLRWRVFCQRVDAGLSVTEEDLAKAKLPDYDPLDWIGRDDEEAQEATEEQ